MDRIKLHRTKLVKIFSLVCTRSITAPNFDLSSWPICGIDRGLGQIHKWSLMLITDIPSKTAYLNTCRSLTVSYELLAAGLCSLIISIIRKWSIAIACYIVTWYKGPIRRSERILHFKPFILRFLSDFNKSVPIYPICNKTTVVRLVA